MNKEEVEEDIEKVIKEYLKKNLRMESRVRYIVGLSQPGMGFTRKEVSEITGLGHQLISDYYIKYKNKYEK